MLKTWYENYADLMDRTSFISKFGALCIFLPAALEVFRIIGAYRGVENATMETIGGAVALPVLLFIVFGFRFVLLVAKARPAVNTFTWVIGVVVLYVYSAQTYLPAFWRDDSGVSRGIYNPFTDPLLILALSFMFFSLIRFGITALSAFAVREADLNTSR